MTKAVFVHRPTSGYDDNPTERYQFAHTHLRQVEKAVGDFIIYFEPKKSGRQAYVAMARVTHIEPDPANHNLYFAGIDPLSFVQFARGVAYQGPSGFYESGLCNIDGTLNRGMVQRAVRALPDIDFELIVEAGLAPVDWSTPGVCLPSAFAFAESPQATFHRQTEQIDRQVRRRAFAQQVQHAYDRTCAVTGLRILNGGGNPEVQAAHIKPVSEQGPDWIRNGIALSGTIHWMFDRGLIAFADDHRILCADRLIPDNIRPLVSQNEYMITPKNPNWQPLPAFLRHHRETRYKGD